MKQTADTRRLPASLLSALLLSLGLSAQQVHVVDDMPGPGVDFTDLQAAVDGASPGDHLLIKDGTYLAANLIIDKDLALIADTGAQVTIQGLVEVRDLPASATFSLQGITVGTPDVDPTLAVVYGLRIRDCAGQVWAQDCNIYGHTWFGVRELGPGVHVGSSDAVTLIDCGVQGGISTSISDIPSAGLFAFDSNVYLFGCSVRGGTGSTNILVETTETGGLGVLLRTATLFAQDSSIQGGTGGDGDTSTPGTIRCITGGSGGIGARLTGDNPRLELFGSTVTGGVGGVTTPCAQGTEGEVLDLESGEVLQASSGGHRLDLDPLTREGEAAIFRVQGESGDLAFLGISLEANAQRFPGVP
ncbi:MAG: right-handed parallel beta-helix repeat-containing protein, partial [Planctomycetota bacterium]